MGFVGSFRHLVKVICGVSKQSGKFPHIGKIYPHHITVQHHFSQIRFFVANTSRLHLFSDKGVFIVGHTEVNQNVSTAVLYEQPTFLYNETSLDLVFVSPPPNSARLFSAYRSSASSKDGFPFVELDFAAMRSLIFSALLT